MHLLKIHRKLMEGRDAMKRVTAIILSMAMVISTLSSNIGAKTVFAATNDTITISYVLEKIDSTGRKTRSEVSETTSSSVAQDGSDRIRITTPACPSGYQFENVEIIDQQADDNIRFENKHIRLPKGETATSFDLPLHPKSEYIRISVYDENGNIANSRGFFRDEWEG